jgi:hypothetical protein
VLGVASIYIAKLPSELCFLGVSRDLHLSDLSLQRRFPGSEIGCALWTRDRERADLVRRRVHAELLPTSDISVLREAIIRAAVKLNIGLTEHETVMTRVGFLVQTIDRRLDEASRNGGLTWFNKAYRKWRLEAKQQGRVMTYSEARARLRRGVMVRMVKHSSDLLPSIFPTLEAAED